MDHSAEAYGLWLLVILNSAVFIIFAFSFFKPQTKRDWRSFTAFSAFIVALFVEMYGFPLTIFLLSGWLQTRAPGLDLLSHDAGHLWNTIFGLKGDTHFNWLHIQSNVLLLAGFWMLAAAWPVLLRNGVRIFEYQRRVLHAKTVICDDWVSIGSSNLDRWGFKWNLEANQEIEHRPFANRAAAMFEADSRESLELARKNWPRRPRLDRLRENMAGMLDRALDRWRRPAPDVSRTKSN